MLLTVTNKAKNKIYTFIKNTFLHI
jgi:hypothetical protein